MNALGVPARFDAVDSGRVSLSEGIFPSTDVPLNRTALSIFGAPL